jgi:hypothetical protein
MNKVEISGLEFSKEEVCHDCPQGSPVPPLNTMGQRWFVVELESPRGFKHSYGTAGVSEESVMVQYNRKLPTWKILAIRPIFPASEP